MAITKNAPYPRFTTDVLIIFEAVFTRKGIHNVHTTHVWNTENPHSIQRDHFPHLLCLNVWTWIVNGRLIGPFI